MWKNKKYFTYIIYKGKFTQLFMKNILNRILFKFDTWFLLGKEHFSLKQCLETTILDDKRLKIYQERSFFMFFCYTYAYKFKQLGECHGTI